MVRNVVTLMLCAAPLAGCAMHPPTWQQRPQWARLGNTSKVDDAAPTFYRDPHHQYYDKQHRQYYYYDPQKKEFFWENGIPKT